MGARVHVLVRDAVFPDRALCTMRSHMMASYVDLLIKTCHRRGIFAMGGMAAQIPIRNDNAANQAALAKVRLYLPFLFFAFVSSLLLGAHVAGCRFVMTS